MQQFYPAVIIGLCILVGHLQILMAGSVVVLEIVPPRLRFQDPVPYILVLLISPLPPLLLDRL